MTKKQISDAEARKERIKNNYFPTKEDFKLISKSIKNGLFVSIKQFSFKELSASEDLKKKYQLGLYYLEVEILNLQRKQVLPTPVPEKHQTWRVVNAYRHFYPKLFS